MSAAVDQDTSPAWTAYAVPTFNGHHDTHIETGEDYRTITLADLFAMQPSDKPKGASPAFLPSLYADYDARAHAKQRELGQFVALTADLDKGNHAPGKVQRAVKAFTGDAAYMIYSSAHARPGDLRWRVIVPLDEPCAFSIWYDAQTAFYAFMASHGIECDHALARAAQPVYLPNVPQVHAKSETPLRDDQGAPLYYKATATALTAPGLLLASPPVSEGIAAIRAKRAQDEQERERMRREAEQRRASMPRGDGASIIDDFNASNSVATMLELCGYEQSPRNDEDWRSPHQTGETYATRVMGSKWFSLSQSDVSAGVGHQCREGCFGDAYDLFVHYKHDGDHKAAYRQLHEERRGHNVVPFPTPEPPEWMAEAPMPEVDELARWVPDYEPGEDYLELAGASPVVDSTDTFQLLSLTDLEHLPPPSWLIDGLITDSGLSILYGDPGSGKSFVTIDMALRIALGMDWHGAETKRTGVIYIAGEGVRGLGNRVKGWRLKHGLSSVDGAPFVLMPVAAQLLDPAERAKLIRTIDTAKIRIGCDVGLIVIDTVSRSIAGQDENGQETMSAFVKACDEVREHCGGAVLGVHHSGKDKDKGMRGSTVLLGACDATFRVQKADTLVTVKCEKQKDGEEAAPIYLKMERHTWTVAGDDKEQSTLVPIMTQAQSMGGGLASLSREQIRDAFAILTDAWTDGKPLSHRPETRKDGRHAPSILSRRLGGDADAWAEAIAAWLETSVVAFEMYDKRAKRRGLQVLDPVL